MISPVLLDAVCCPDCRGALRAESDELVCAVCGRRASATGRDYLDLRPAETFAESTKYLDDEMHADGRHAHVTPPLLTAAIRNDMLRSLLKIAGGDRVIDLGCGSGRVLVWNLVPDVEFVGVDVSPHFAAEALENAICSWAISGSFARGWHVHEGVLARCAGAPVTRGSPPDVRRGEPDPGEAARSSSTATCGRTPESRSDCAPSISWLAFSNASVWWICRTSACENPIIAIRYWTSRTCIASPARPAFELPGSVTTRRWWVDSVLSS